MWDEDDDDVWNDEDDWVVSRGRIYPSDLVFPLLGLARRVTNALGEAIADYQHLVGGRINWLRQQDQFYEEAGAAIEALTGKAAR